jgi:hypothetical protein
MTLMALVNYFICHAKESKEIKQGSTYFIKNVNVELSENFCSPKIFFRLRFFGFSLRGFAIASQTAVDAALENYCCFILKIHKVIIILLTHADRSREQTIFQCLNFSSSLLFKNVINIKCYFSRLDFIVSEKKGESREK